MLMGRFQKQNIFLEGNLGRRRGEPVRLGVVCVAQRPGRIGTSSESCQWVAMEYVT